MRGNHGDFSQSAQGRSVTDGASNRFARAAGGDQFFSFGNAACGNVSNKSGVRIAALCSGGILWQFDNAIADRLLAAATPPHARPDFIDDTFWEVIRSLY